MHACGVMPRHATQRGAAQAHVHEQVLRKLLQLPQRPAVLPLHMFNLANPWPWPWAGGTGGKLLAPYFAR